MIVEGQVHGGLVQGIAQALFEEAVYDDSGTLVTGSFVDYLVPSAADLPSFTTDRTETPATSNPLGVKGVGEAGTIASTPAVVNAIVDAVRQLGINDIEMPCTPHRVWTAIQNASTGDATPADNPTVDDNALPSHNAATSDGGAVMIPAAFDYVAPESVADALAALGSDAEEIKVLAGGQSLMPVLKLRLAAPTLLVDLGRIPGLRGISDDGDAIVIGAMTTHDEVANSALVDEHAAVLAKATKTVADPQVRHRGTFGGALAHADPAGDLPAPILALDAELVIAGPGGERTVAAADFFEDLFTTAVGEDEILTADPDPEAHRLGRALREVHPGRAGVVDRRRSRRPSRPTAARSREAKIGLTNMGRRRCARPRSRRRWSASPRPPRRSRRPARRLPTAPTRRPTPTATRTIVDTWRRCSPAGPSWLQPGDPTSTSKEP